MTRFAKHLSAADLDGSAMPGSVFGRLAFATRGGSRGSDGSGTSSAGLGLVLLVLLICVGVNAAAAGAAVPAKGVTGFFGTSDQLAAPRGVAVNQASGNTYVVDGTSNRIVVFDPNGKFLRTFGGDVVASGPDQADELQVVKVAATAGEFTLSFGDTTTPLPATATAVEVEDALNALDSISAEGGSVTVSGGPGSATGSTPYRVTFDGGSLAATDVDQLSGTNVSLTGGNPATAITIGTARPGATGFEVCVPVAGDVCKGGSLGNSGGVMNAPQGVAVDQVSGDVYVTDQGNRRVQRFDQDGSFLSAFGKDVVTTGFPGHAAEASAVQTLTVTATGGKYTLAFGGKSTAELPFDASAASIQTALTGLSSIGAGNVSVTETSPGVYRIAFAGNLANNPEPLIVAATGAVEPLSGGTATVADTIIGSRAYEICVIGNGDVCKAGAAAAQGTIGGGFAATVGHPAVAPAGAPNAGNVLVADAGNLRVQEFTASGAFVRAFGFDVVKAGPGNTGGFEVCALSAGDACKVGVAGSGSGQFAAATPTRIAEGAAGNVYTVEPTTNFRVQRFTLPGNVVTPQGNFDEADLKGTAATNAPLEIAINPANENVLVAKAFAAGATASCPILGTPSPVENRVVEVSPAGSLETTSGHHGTCAGITPVSGLAVRGSSGNLYISSTFISPRVYVLNTGQPAAPSLLITNVSGVGSHGVTINALINPHGPELPYGQETTYAIEYKRVGDASFTKFSNSEATAGNRTTDKAIAISLGGLEANTSYDVRLTANKGFGSGSVSQTISFTTSPSVPDVSLPSFAIVNGTNARLTGSVNPNNQASGYHFEYVDEPSFQASGFAAAVHLPSGDVSVGSGAAAVAASQVATGLTPGQTYRYRLVASSAFGQTVRTGTFAIPDPSACANRGIRGEQTSASNPAGTGYLPDCMAFEMVSPSQKFNQRADTPDFSASDDVLQFRSIAALGGTPQLSQTNNPYVATRDDGGWTTHAVQPPSGLLEGNPTPCSYDPLLTRWTISGARPVGTQYTTTWPFTGTLAGDFEPLGPVLTPLQVAFAASSGGCKGGSADASRLFTEGRGLTYLPGEPPVASGFNGLASSYEVYRDPAGNPVVELLSRDKDGRVWGGTCGTQVGWQEFAPTAEQGAISADGARVYFSARPGQGTGTCDGASNGMRVMERHRTADGPVIREISASECTRVSPSCSAAGGDDLFRAANRETGRVFFTSPRQLANSDLDTGSGCDVGAGGSGCDLYLYDASRPEGSRLTQVSAGDASAPTPGAGANVRGVLDVSGDGSHAYFVAEGVLTTSLSPAGTAAEAGKPNLYGYERSADHPTGRIAFIGTLPTTDAGLWGESGGGYGPGRNPAIAVPRLGADVEDPSVGGNGHIIVFVTGAALAPGDTDGAEKDVYRYDSGTGALDRISAAGPGGSDGGAFAVGMHNGRADEVHPVQPQSLYFGRAVSEDGRTVAFSTSEGLDPADGDGASTIYVWQEGVIAAVRGSLGPPPSSNIGTLRPAVSTTGDVAFVSTEKLLPEDGDAARDVYVLRSGGGFPLPVAEIPCAGEACQAPFGAQPVEQAPASQNSSGPGNPPAATKCPKGKRQVKRKGKVRCVPKKRPGKQRKHHKGKQGERHASANGRTGS